MFDTERVEKFESELAERMRITEENIREFCKYSHLLGERLGVGISRMVFNHITDNSLIVKVEKYVYDPKFGKRPYYIESRNKREVDLWNSGKYDDVLAPVIWHSDDYEVLFMVKARTITKEQETDKFNKERNELEIRLVDVTSDVHGGNVGYINNKLVVIDYAELPWSAVGVDVPSTIEIDVPLSSGKYV